MLRVDYVTLTTPSPPPPSPLLAGICYLPHYELIFRLSSSALTRIAPPPLPRRCNFSPLLILQDTVLSRDNACAHLELT